jgi:hypothetical protein
MKDLPVLCRQKCEHKPCCILVLQCGSYRAATTPVPPLSLSDDTSSWPCGTAPPLPDTANNKANVCYMAESKQQSFD